MKPRPTIFLSGVSHEFGSFRDAVEIEIQKKGCFVENQPSFATDYRTIETMLRQKLSEADAVIHIVGFRYGAEPHDRPVNAPRRSYTQMEFDIARELEKPVYVFLSDNASIRDAAKPDEKPEDAEVSALQLVHRDIVRATDHLYYVFKEKDDLCRLAAAIPTVAAVDFRADISRIDKYTPAELIGREDELALLDEAWLKVRRAEAPRTHVITFVALGGEGKTSLVAKWAAELAHDGWPGCDAAFAWSFYSQGTRAQSAASSDLFFKEAITFFGDEADKEFAASSAGAYEKGQRLARIVGQRSNLLILDGLEPLQYAPTSPTAGELKDHGIAALLKGLAANSKGLCIVTTRYSLPDLTAFRQTTAPELKLVRLSRDAGVMLLKALGVKGSSSRNISLNDGREQVNEFEKLVEDAKGHALTLNLLGTYLRDAHGGDIRRRDLVKLEEADAEEQAGRAFRVIEAYEEALEEEGEKGKRALVILRLLGLFDKPIDAGCLTALLKGPAIPDLTDQLIGLSDAQRNLAFKRLEDAKLLTIIRDSSGSLLSVDAHPLLREYFAKQLRTQQPDAWRSGHRRLYEHLTKTTPDKPQPTLEDLQPLFQAVAHGCHAGLHQEVCANVYRDRILQGGAHYTWNKLGAYASELGAQVCFFDVPWSRPSPALSEEAHAWLLHETAFCLQALGRLTEALEPTRVSGMLSVKAENWVGAAMSYNNVSELELLLGKMTEAVEDAEQSLIYADRSRDVEAIIGISTSCADVLHQAGDLPTAKTLFSESEQLQARYQPEYPLHYSVQGFQYCDLLLGATERIAWKQTLEPGYVSGRDQSSHFDALDGVFRRTTQTLRWAAEGNLSLLTIALHRVTQARILLFASVLSRAVEQSSPVTAELKKTIDVALSGLRQTGIQAQLPRGLLVRCWQRFLTGARVGSESAQEDLDEAWEIAERGPMRLHMADIHLYRARLFFREANYPWESPRADLEAAERLINECGYHRRDEELADAKRAILGIQSV